MAEKINLSLDDIIAKEGIGLDSSKSFAQRVVKKDLKNDSLSKVVISIDNDSNASKQTTNKRKVDFEDGLSETSVGSTSGKGSAFPTTTGQIFVNNLKYEVNDDDIQQLFGAFGAVRRAAVNYQEDGRSAGSAFVVFQSKSDAESAVKSLQNITLDGRALHLTLIDTNKSSFARNSNDINSRVKRQAKESSGSGRHIWTDIARSYDSTPTEQRNFRRSNRSDDNKTKEKEVINAEDLDADLESYLAQRKKE